MFQSKIITKDTLTDLPTILSEVKANPKRHFTIEANSFNFPGTKIKKALENNCGVIIKSDGIYSKNQIKEFIDVGKELVVLQPKGFEEDDLLIYLEKGASTFVAKTDGFDNFQITKMVDKGNERITVVGGKDDFSPTQMKNYLIAGGSISLKKLDFPPSTISELLPLGENRIHINATRFRNKRVDEFLDGKAIVTFGIGNQFSQPRIKQKVEKYTSQIFIESAHFNFDLPWVEELEVLGANII